MPVASRMLSSPARSATATSTMTLAFTRRRPRTMLARASLRIRIQHRLRRELFGERRQRIDLGEHAPAEQDHVGEIGTSHQRLPHERARAEHVDQAEQRRWVGGERPDLRRGGVKAAEIRAQVERGLRRIRRAGDAVQDLVGQVGEALDGELPERIVRAPREAAQVFAHLQAEHGVGGVVELWIVVLERGEQAR